MVVAEALDLVDFEAAAEVSGQKFYYLRNAAVGPGALHGAVSMGRAGGCCKGDLRNSKLGLNSQVLARGWGGGRTSLC